MRITAAGHRITCSPAMSLAAACGVCFFAGGAPRPPLAHCIPTACRLSDAGPRVVRSWSPDQMPMAITLLRLPLMLVSISMGVGGSRLAVPAMATVAIHHRLALTLLARILLRVLARAPQMRDRVSE